MDLLSYFPYQEPREIQKAALEVLGANWDNYEVFVLSAPTAFGKTAVARTLCDALRSVSVITPTNLLVEQFRTEFPDTPSLSRLDSYHCEEWKRPCSSTRAKLAKFCKGCQCGKDLSTAKYRRGPGVYNYHTYLSHKLYRDVLIVDEAHNLLPIIRERFALTLWQHDYHYPSTAWRPEQLLQWASKLSEKRKKTRKVEALLDALESNKPLYTAQRTKQWFNGKGTIRGEPEERDCIQLLPVDIRGVPALFWPREVRKIVLLSATISRKDIEALGLDRRKVLYINCESPIPADSRPIVAVPITAVNRHNMPEATRKIGEYIDRVVAPQHVGEKGLVHATYQMAAQLREILTGPRYMFHDRFNKREVYQMFRDSDPAYGRILVASGMYEGIDLPEDLGRFQVIAKVPWPSLGNAAIRYQSEQDPDWYLWETLRITIQAAGRICRTPEDFGTTLIIDSSFERLIRESSNAGLVPQWFMDGLASGSKLV